MVSKKGFGALAGIAAVLVVGLVAVWQTGVLRSGSTPSEDVSGSMVEPQASGMEIQGQMVPFTTVEQGTMGPWRSELTLLVESAEEWASEMDALLASDQLYGVPEPPTMDWKHRMAVLVTMGERTTGGYDIEIVGVHRQGRELVLDVLKTTPGPGLKPQMITTPFHCIEVDRKGVDRMRVQERWQSGDGTVGTASGEGILSEDSTERTSWGALKQKYDDSK